MLAPRVATAAIISALFASVAHAADATICIGECVPVNGPGAGVLTVACQTCTIVPNVNVFQAEPSQNSQGLYQYAFDAGGTLSITSVSIPYFSDAAIQVISTSAGWAASVEPTNDAFGLGNSAGTMTWTATAAAAGTDLVVDFESPYAATQTAGSAVLSDGSLHSVSFDIPLSPDAIAAGLTPAPVSSVPEPSSALLGAMALCALLLTVRRSRS